MSGLEGIKVTGVGVKHNFKDDKGERHKFTQNYKYIPLTCPVCKTMGEFLYPALNQCGKCGAPLAFCVINDGNHHIGLWDLKKLIKELEEVKDGSKTGEVGSGSGEKAN
jgi:hypothetical protein